jgi:hypothetical protein
MPRAQAEVVVKGLTAMFIHHFNAVVTKDFLGIRFSELEARIDLRFADMETRFARVNVMLGVILAALAIPVLQTLLLWVG